MASLANFAQSGGVKIEVDGGQPVTATSYSAELSSAITSVVASAAGQMFRIPKEQQPTQFTVEFALRALNNGGFAICLDENSANFRVTLQWGGDGGGILGGLNIPIPSP